MRLELRRSNATLPEAYDLVLIADTDDSALLDKAFGSRVDASGLIATVTGEVRLSDGCREHYIRLVRSK